MRDDQPPLPSRMTVGLSSYATVSSFSVPIPPEIMITASAARTVSVFRIQPMPVVTAMSTNSFASRLSKPGRIPITRPPAFLAPRLTASMTPREPARDDDALALGDETPDLFGHAQS